MTDEDFPIEPSTKVAALLDHYPELEEFLIEIAPPFKKLTNPILRKSVAKVASLQQAAAVGRMPVAELVNRLRAEVGQEAIAWEDAGETASYFTSRPDWFDRAKVVASIDESETDEDKMTLITVNEHAGRLRESEILELITAFLPAPGIDVMKKRGFLVWSVQEEPDLIRTFFSKPAQS